MHGSFPDFVQLLDDHALLVRQRAVSPGDLEGLLAGGGVVPPMLGRWSSCDSSSFASS